MSKSRKLPIFKDKGICRRNIFRRKIKRRIRQIVKDIKNLLDVETYDIPNPKTIVNCYDWCDYIFDYRFTRKRQSEEYNAFVNNLKIKCSRK